MPDRVVSLYICPWSLIDPLAQSQSLGYLNILTKYGYRFALITFETSRFSLKEEELQKVKEGLAEAGINWYPVEWHLGSTLPQKIKSGFSAMLMTFKAVWKHNPRIIHSRSSTPALFALLAAKIFGKKFLYDADSILSQEYVDVGHWSKESLNFKILAKAESLARGRADKVIVLTEMLKKDFVNRFGVEAPIEVIPCCVDVDEFAALPEVRNEKRRELKLGDEKLLVYVGKIGVRYQVEKVFEFFKTARENFEAKLLIVSLDAPGKFDEIAAAVGVSKESYFIVNSKKNQVKEWLSAADAGIAFIKQAECERGSSPIKISEYLASGLPVLISDNIGDVSSLVEREKIGLVVKEHNAENYRLLATRLKELWNDEWIAQRCRQTAGRAFDLYQVGGRKYFDLYEGLSRSQKVDSFYICPWSLQDSLSQSQSLSYLKGLTANGYKFALMTFENPVFKSELALERQIKDELAGRGIFWYPVQYRKGTSIFNKFFESMSGLLTGLSILRKHCPSIVHSRSSLPTAIAVTLSKAFKLKFLYDADSMLSEEYADTGHWSRDDNAYKLTARLEGWARRNATEMIVLTETLREDLRRQYHVKVPIEVIPCCVDTEKFKFTAEGRRQKRAELGLTNEKLLTYVGKVGSWYLVEETFDFFKAFYQEQPASRLLIVSRDEPKIFHQIARERGISPDLYFVRSASHSEVAEWLSASEIGLCLIKQARSKRGSSPVKFAEYLSVGLPVVSTDGIGDCTRVIENEKVGVVLRETNAAAYREAVKQLSNLCAEDPEELARRCRKTAEKEFSLESVGVERYRKIYKRLSEVHS